MIWPHMIMKRKKKSVSKIPNFLEFETGES